MLFNGILSPTTLVLALALQPCEQPEACRDVKNCARNSRNSRGNSEKEGARISNSEDFNLYQTVSVFYTSSPKIFFPESFISLKLAL